MAKSRFVAAVLAAAVLAGCNESEPSAPPIRPVRSVTIERNAGGEAVSLTGHVRAKDQVSLAFRLDGRIIERPVNVGDIVQAGQVIARLDPQNQQNVLRSAQAGLSAAEAVLTEARLNFVRQQSLVAGGWTPRARFDSAQQTLQSAQAQVDSAQAQLRIAQDQLGYAVLVADTAGAVTSVGAEPGEVVRAGQMVVQVAGEAGRDAVFDVPEQLIQAGPRDPVVEIVLTNDPKTKATGRVREVSPQADPVTRTFRVKVGINEPPEGMRLGSTVTGRIRLAAAGGVEVPASALTEAGGRPAVWVVDPGNHTVALRRVEIERYDRAGAIVSSGLEPGEIVVTAGVQVLRPNQKVRLLGAAS